jgi:hypothetical protein
MVTGRFRAVVARQYMVVLFIKNWDAVKLQRDIGLHTLHG